MAEVDSSEMVAAGRCWGRPVEAPALAEGRRRQEVGEVEDSTAAGTGQVEDRAEDRPEDKVEVLVRDT